MDAGAALAHDDGAGVHELAVEYLGTEPLGGRIAAVTAGATCFGLGHLSFLLGADLLGGLHGLFLATLIGSCFVALGGTLRTRLLLPAEGNVGDFELCVLLAVAL